MPKYLISFSVVHQKEFPKNSTFYSREVERDRPISSSEDFVAMAKDIVRAEGIVAAEIMLIAFSRFERGLHAVRRNAALK